MKFNLVSPINDTSYGLTSLNILKSLTDAGNHVSLFPITLRQDIPQYFIPYVQQALNNAKGLDFDFSSACIRIWHQFDMSMFAGNGMKIGFPIFELDGFTDIEKYHLGSLDYCFVCSEWAKSLLIKHKILPCDKISVVNLGVDTSIFKPEPHRKTDNFVFLNIGKWEIRKGHDILADLFADTFSSADNVELWMCNHNVHLTEQEHNEWVRFYTTKLGDMVKFIPRLPTQQDLARIINMSDCGIYPSRAEGWNLEAVETLACGKELIITDCTAHSEYCKELKYIEPLENQVPAYDGKWFFKQGLWCDITETNKNNLSHMMREVYNNNKEGYQTNEAYIKLANKFTWENTAKQISASIR